MKLYDYQLDAIERMKNGCILCGGVGSGKSLTALGYYYLCNGGSVDFLKGGAYVPMNMPSPDLYIITTARKRDTREWDGELGFFHLYSGEVSPLFANRVTVDSWNNIVKYKDARDAFFIFDEQRVVGSGVWVKTFLKIAKHNQWILLSATPGDTWQDYAPVFVANGYFRNRTQFRQEHVIYSQYSKFPKIEGYMGTAKLAQLRNDILVNMDFHRDTVSHHEDIFVKHDSAQYRQIVRNRWDIWDDKPIENAGGLCYAMRKAVNSDASRTEAVLDICRTHPKVIIFYNFNYELDLLKRIEYLDGTAIAEWNGHQHQPIPSGDRWVYLVQYAAGAEGWNCITTDTMIFFSQNYSYKVMAQASGRIDRLNTPYRDLYFYHLKSRASIDAAISKALREKKTFNERGFVKW